MGRCLAMVLSLFIGVKMSFRFKDYTDVRVKCGSPKEDFLYKPIDEIGLAPHVFGVLKQRGIGYVFEFIRYSLKDLQVVESLDASAVANIDLLLSSKGLSLASK